MMCVLWARLGKEPGRRWPVSHSWAVSQAEQCGVTRGLLGYQEPLSLIWTVTHKYDIIRLDNTCILVDHHGFILHLAGYGIACHEVGGQ
eukprot:9416757-Prorocentrum_lima.AAC.1